MIRVTRLDGTQILLNAELIESVEATPDTLVTLVTRTRLMVRETPEEVYELVVAYRQRVQAGLRRYS
ncbi:MAG: flagellar FlbD family protein [Candidatus Schekmanbacteria bacterium]|nr:flagellar FlbD family protein [Candidatus Schekmanbacteria bacterium]